MNENNNIAEEGKIVDLVKNAVEKRNAKIENEQNYRTQTEELKHLISEGKESDMMTVRNNYKKSPYVNMSIHGKDAANHEVYVKNNKVHAVLLENVRLIHEFYKKVLDEVEAVKLDEGAWEPKYAEIRRKINDFKGKHVETTVDEFNKFMQDPQFAQKWNSTRAKVRETSKHGAQIDASTIKIERKELTPAELKKEQRDAKRKAREEELKAEAIKNIKSGRSLNAFAGEAVLSDEYESPAIDEDGLFGNVLSGIMNKQAGSDAIAVKEEADYHKMEKLSNHTDFEDAYYKFLSNDFKKSENLLKKLLKNGRFYSVHEQVAREALWCKNEYFNAVALLVNKTLDFIDSDQIINNPKLYITSTPNDNRDKAILTKINHRHGELCELANSAHSNKCNTLVKTYTYTNPTGMPKMHKVDNKFMSNLLMVEDTFKLIKELDKIIDKLPDPEHPVLYEKYGKELASYEGYELSPVHAYIQYVYNVAGFVRVVRTVLTSYVSAVYRILAYTYRMK